MATSTSVFIFYLVIAKVNLLKENGGQNVTTAVSLRDSNFTTLEKISFEKSKDVTSSILQYNISDKVLINAITMEKKKINFTKFNKNLMDIIIFLRDQKKICSLNCTLKVTTDLSKNGTICGEVLYISSCGKSLNTTWKSCTTNETNYKELHYVVCQVFGIITSILPAKRVSDNTSCEKKLITYDCNSLMEKKNNVITYSIHSTSSKLQKDLLNACNGFGIDKAICTCSLFEVKYATNRAKLCMVMNTKSDSISQNVVEHTNVWLPNIMKKSCSYFNLSSTQCQCQQFKLLRKKEEKNFCRTSGSVAPPLIDSLDQLCWFFNVSKNKCSCEIFEIGESQKLFESVCDLEKYLNSTIHIIIVYDPVYVRTHASIGIVAALAGMTGNTLVLVVAIVNRKGQSTCKTLFAHLAASDLLFAVLQFIYFIPKYWTTDWLYGLAMCKVLKSSEMLGSMVAIGIILIISMERYIGILEPFRRGISKSGMQCILAFNIVLGIASIIPLILYNKTDVTKICRPMWPRLEDDTTIYNSYILIMYFFIPVVIITFLYVRIILNLHGTVTFGNENWIADPRLRLKRVTDNKKTMYMLLAVVIAFITFVFPRHIVYIYFDTRGWTGETIRTGDITTYFILMYIANMPYPLHVAINPIIYSILDAKWRKNVKKLIWNIPVKTRGLSTTLTSVAGRRRSSSGVILDRSTEDLRIPYSLKRSTLHIDVETTSLPSPTPSPLIRRAPHLSDSSTKSTGSDCPFTEAFS